MSYIGGAYQIAAAAQFHQVSEATAATTLQPPTQALSSPPQPAASPAPAPQPAEQQTQQPMEQGSVEQQPAPTSEQSSTVQQPTPAAPPVETPSPVSASTPPRSAVPPLIPNSIQILDQVIPIVDDQGAPAAPEGYQAGFWKGTGEVDDNQPTHIIGHNPGAFQILFSLSVGSQVTVMDHNGHTRTYTIYQQLKVDDYGIGDDGQLRWDDILNQPGESISLQTCIDDNWNEMYLAR